MCILLSCSSFLISIKAGIQAEKAENKWMENVSCRWTPADVHLNRSSNCCCCCCCCGGGGGGVFCCSGVRGGCEKLLTHRSQKQITGEHFISTMVLLILLTQSAPTFYECSWIFWSRVWNVEKLFQGLQRENRIWEFNDKSLPIQNGQQKRYGFQSHIISMYGLIFIYVYSIVLKCR